MKKLLLLICLLPALAISQPCINNVSSAAFDGTTSYVAIATSNGLTITGPITVEAWIYPTAWALTAAQGTIVCKHSWNQGEQGYVLRAGDNGTLSFNIGGLTTGGVAVGWVEVLSQVNALTLNTWQHVAGEFDGDSLKLYINGVLSGVTLFQGSIVASTASNIRIGALSDVSYGPARYWTGNIDEVRVWDRELTPAEIIANKDNHIDPATQTGLKGYWRFNENTSIIAYDLSGNNNTGQMTAATWSPNVPFNTYAAAPVISFNGTQLVSTAAVSYQWSLNGTPLPSGTLQNWTPLVNGTYTVTITNAFGCTATSAAFPFNSVGIDETGNQSFTITHNQNNVYSISSPVKLMKELVLFDLGGRELVRSRPDGNKQAEINLQNFVQGIYLLQVITDEGIYPVKIRVQ